MEALTSMREHQATYENNEAQLRERLQELENKLAGEMEDKIRLEQRATKLATTLEVDNQDRRPFQNWPAFSHRISTQQSRNSLAHWLASVDSQETGSFVPILKSFPLTWQVLESSFVELKHELGQCTNHTHILREDLNALAQLVHEKEHLLPRSLKGKDKIVHMYVCIFFWTTVVVSVWRKKLKLSDLFAAQECQRVPFNPASHRSRRNKRAIFLQSTQTRMCPFCFKTHYPEGMLQLGICGMHHISPVSHLWLGIYFPDVFVYCFSFSWGLSGCAELLPPSQRSVRNQHSAADRAVWRVLRHGRNQRMDRYSGTLPGVWVWTTFQHGSRTYILGPNRIGMESLTWNPLNPTLTGPQNYVRWFWKSSWGQEILFISLSLSISRLSFHWCAFCRPCQGNWTCHAQHFHVLWRAHAIWRDLHVPFSLHLTLALR